MSTSSRLSSRTHTVWMIIFGLLFDLFQLGLSLSDAVSDAAVAWEFRENGQTYFFYTTAALLVLGCVSDAVAFLISIERTFKLSQWYQWVICVSILTPFAQLLPIISYLLQKCGTGYGEDFAEYVNWDEKDQIFGASNSNNNNNNNNVSSSNNNNNNSAAFANEVTTAADQDTGDAARELHRKASDQETLITLDEFVASRQAAFMVMNCQTLAESAPQCIVQLIAISLVDAPTNLQVISLSLSLFGVASKTFQLCRSYVSSAFWAKLFFVVHDIFSISFLFSSLFSSSLPKTSSFFGLQVCGLTWWWLFLKLLDVVCISAIVFAIMVQEVSRENGLSNKVKLIGLFCTFYILGVVPVAIVQETAKLAWYLPLNLSFAPSAQATPRLPLLHDFLWSGSGELKRQWTDWKATFAKFESFMLESARKAKVAAKASGDNDALHHSGTVPNYLQTLSTLSRRPRVNQGREHGLMVKYLTFPLGPTFRRLAQPLPPPCEDPTEGTGHEKPSSIFNDKSTNQYYRRDDFFARALHCLRIYRCHQINSITQEWDNYYNRTTDTVPYFAQRFNAFWIRQLERNTHAFIDENNVKFGLREVIPLLDAFRGSEFERVKKERLDFRYGVKNRLENNENPAPVPYVAPPTKVAAIAAFVVVATLTALTSIFGLVYPIVFACHYFGTMHLMQHVCFYPTIFCLIGSLVSLPAAVRYLCTGVVFTNGLENSTDPIGLVVDSYFSVPLTTLRVVAVPSSTVIPADAFDTHVLQFLDLKHVGLFGLFGKQFENVEKMLETSSSSSKKRQ